MKTTVAKLLAQKEELLKRLEQTPDDNERAEIEGILTKINTALNYLDDANPTEL